MNELTKLSRDAQIVLAATVLYIILSFLDWQQYCAGEACIGQTEWNGIGVIAGLTGVALLLWEVNRMLGMKFEFGSLPPALISVALAIALLVLTVITFLSHDEFRNWPQWLALIVSIVLVVVAIRRGRDEGVEMPKMASGTGSGAGSGGGSTSGGSSAGTDGSDSSAAGGDEGGERPPEA